MSNFAPYSVKYNGINYQTSEHAFQAQKFLNKFEHDLVWLTQSPSRAAEIGRDRKLHLREDWESVKNKIMYKVVQAKFEQHPSIKVQLLLTDDALLVEDSPTDYYWGCGKDGTGKNMLGQMLMHIRDRMIKNKADEQALEDAWIDYNKPTDFENETIDTPSFQEMWDRVQYAFRAGWKAAKKHAS